MYVSRFVSYMQMGCRRVALCACLGVVLADDEGPVLILTAVAMAQVTKPSNVTQPINYVSLHLRSPHKVARSSPENSGRQGDV